MVAQFRMGLALEFNLINGRLFKESHEFLGGHDPALLTAAGSDKNSLCIF